MNTLKITLSFVLLLVTIQIGICQVNTNKEIARRYFKEVVNQQRLDLLNKIFADSFFVNNMVINKKRKKSIGIHKDFLKKLFSAFPDIHYTINNIVAEDNKVAMTLSFSGTHQGEIFGYEASGNYIDHMSEIFFFRIEEGEIKETWFQLDLHTLNNKLKKED